MHEVHQLVENDGLFHRNVVVWYAEYRLLNQSYLQSIGVNYLPGYADPYGGRSVTFVVYA